MPLRSRPHRSLPVPSILRRLGLVLALPLLAAGCSKHGEPDRVALRAPGDAQQVAATPAKAAAVDWETGGVDAAFAKAKIEGKPVFLYWGASWCPPCNQVKATIFTRQEFIERSRLFIPVYVDGDTPSAQRLGSRFKVSAYPTMVLFSPEGGEVTRLPGEVDYDQYMRVLALGMSAARPIRETLDAALADAPGPGTPALRLSPEDWRMLAYYAWDTDDQQVVPKHAIASTLERLARLCPRDQAETADRLDLKALAARASDKGTSSRRDDAAAGRVRALLANAKFVRENFDMFVYSAGDIAKSVTSSQSSERAALTHAWDGVLAQLAADPSLSHADRLAAVSARIELARLGAPDASLDATLLKQVRDAVAHADQAAQDPYTRQAVISAGADVLTEAGLLDESDALLKAELTRSHAPYYYMLGLAANAKKRGDGRAALDWYEKSYASAEGPATRLQWGVRYVSAVVELAPDDAERVERAAKRVIEELEASPDTFYDRNRSALERMGRKLGEWNKDGRRASTLERLRRAMNDVCARLPASDPSRTSCEDVLRTGAATKA